MLSDLDYMFIYIMYDISATGLNGLTVRFEGSHFPCSHTMYCMYFNSRFFKKIFYTIKSTAELSTVAYFYSCRLQGQWEPSISDFFQPVKIRTGQTVFSTAHVHKDTQLHHSFKSNL